MYYSSYRLDKDGRWIISSRCTHKHETEDDAILCVANRTWSSNKAGTYGVTNAWPIHSDAISEEETWALN